MKINLSQDALKSFMRRSDDADAVKPSNQVAAVAAEKEIEHTAVTEAITSEAPSAMEVDENVENEETLLENPIFSASNVSAETPIQRIVIRGPGAVSAGSSGVGGVTASKTDTENNVASKGVSPPPQPSTSSNDTYFPTFEDLSPPPQTPPPSYETINLDALVASLQEDNNSSSSPHHNKTSGKEILKSVDSSSSEQLKMRTTSGNSSTSKYSQIQNATKHHARIKNNYYVFV